jgi:Family of unknown function (DUF5906)
LHADKKTGDQATFGEQPRHALIVDVDHIPCPAAIDPRSDPDGAIEYVIGLLPPDLQDATAWWQFSSSQSVTSSDTLSVHLWFWSAEPLGNAELKRWGALVNKVAGYKLVDTSLYSAVQPHYVAMPIFKGIENPLPRRCGLRQGLDEAVSLIIPTPNPKRPEEPSAGGYEPGLGVDAYLAEIGGPRGFREPIKRVIASWVAVCGIHTDAAAIKQAIREAILRSGGGQDQVGRERYFDSDDHLDAIIEWVRTQHGERPPKGAGTPIGGLPAVEGVQLDDFYAYMETHSYIYIPTRAMWPAGSVNARIPPIPIGPGAEIPATAWLDRHRPVEQMTWAPGLPMIIRNRLISEGGWFDRNNVSCFNLYLPPIIKPGDATQAGKWTDHVSRVFPDDVQHIIKWLAHRVQRPHEKINHALVLGGQQGIGKDTILEPVKLAIGPWNFTEVSPQQVMGRFNGFLKSVILRINEARDLGETDRFKFYDHMKAYTAAPPDVLRVDEKNLREHSILNCCGVLITTNHKTDGIYLPTDDRRNFVAWSDLKKEFFEDSYWTDLYGWYENGGAANVAAYLAGLDLSGFNSKAPPPKTAAFWEIVDASRAPEDGELADVLDQLNHPQTVTIQQLIRTAPEPFNDWLRDRRNARLIPHRLEECGYVAVRNNNTTDGRWKLGGKNQVIYAQASLSIRERYIAAADRVRSSR